MKLNVQHLHKSFGGVHAVDGADFSFEEGKVTAIVGPNGSGKSTTINLLTGVIPFEKGILKFGEHTTLSKISAHEIPTYGMTRTFQDVKLFEQMTVLDNLLVVLTEREPFKALFEKHTKFHLDVANTILKTIGLHEKKHDFAINLSYGQRKLLEIGRVMVMEEAGYGAISIIFLDEPFAGLFKEMIETVSELITSFKKSGKAVVLVEHNMDIIRALSDYVIVMDAGKILAEGKPEEVLTKRSVIEAYLGA